MKVSELIQILQAYNQDAIVHVQKRDAYSMQFDEGWRPVTDVDIENATSWDHDNNCAIPEVYIQ